MLLVTGDRTVLYRSATRIATGCCCGEVITTSILLPNEAEDSAVILTHKEAFPMSWRHETSSHIYERHRYPRQ